MAFGSTRKLARDAEQLRLGEAPTAEQAAQGDAGRPADFSVAVAGLLEKSKPRFEGR